MKYALCAEGLALIQECEGFQAEPQQLPHGVWVVGHSHICVAGPGAPVSRDEAAALLAADLAPVERLVNETVTQTLSQAQFDALVSFAFSIGADSFRKSQTLRRINAGDVVAAACAMDAWRKGDGDTVLAALVRRRAAEKALFLRDTEVAPSAVVRPKLDYAASVLGAPASHKRAPAADAAPAPKLALAQRLTEILRSEPATETLLLTQVVIDTPDEEITTAHAKPVARAEFQPPTARRRAKSSSPKRFVLPAMFQGFLRRSGAEAEA